jgi:hypothetical protein
VFMMLICQPMVFTTDNTLSFVVLISDVKVHPQPSYKSKLPYFDVIKFTKLLYSNEK